MQYEIDIQFDVTAQVLQALAREINAPRQLLASVGQSLLHANEERHRQGLDPEGHPWAELKPATIARKKDPRMLYEHGDLLRFYSQVHGDAVQVGTVDKKAPWHHFGTAAHTKIIMSQGVAVKLGHGGGLPARPLVGFSAADEQLTRDVIEDNLLAILHNARV